jgi:hypothetical protein
MSRPFAPRCRRACNTAMLVLPLLLPVQACSNTDTPLSPDDRFTTGLQASLGSADVTMPVPFKGRMEGLHVSRTPIQSPLFFDVFELSGQATQLGQFKLVIETVVNFGSFPVTGAGTLTFTAANGDRLIANATGSSRLLQPGLVLITEQATIDPAASTGRFAGATGTFTVQRQADAATGVTGITRGTFGGTILLRDRGQGHY